VALLAFSESDSDWSSLERKQGAPEAPCKMNRKSTAHKRVRKKRTAIAVPTPRVPPTPPYAPADATGVHSFHLKEDKARNLGSSIEKGIQFKESRKEIPLPGFECKS